MSGVAVSYCGGCGSQWRAPDAAHCPMVGCHDTFETVALFDAHRDHGRCLDPAMVDDQYGAPVMEWRSDMWRRPAPTRRRAGKGTPST